MLFCVLKMFSFLSTCYLKGFSIALVLVEHYNTMHIFTFLSKEETNPMYSSHLRLNAIEVLQLECLFSSKNMACGCFKQWYKHHSM